MAISPAPLLFLLLSRRIVTDAPYLRGRSRCVIIVVQKESNLRDDAALCRKLRYNISHQCAL